MSDERQVEKRTRLRGDERRASILRSAKRVFARSSYAEASTSELARASEVTEPMLYKHFGSKKGLFMAVLGESAEQFRDSLQERLTRRAEKDVLDALEHIIDEYLTAIKADPETQRLLFQAVTESSDPDIAYCVGKHNRTMYQLLHELVERAQQAGYLDPMVSADAATWGYMSIILATQYGLMLNLSGDVVRVQEEMSRVWLRGLRTHRA
ncbi:MAG TPA: TetR/AcrR family transcriptional regulator [Ktedonobacteraceae bacterium]